MSVPFVQTYSPNSIDSLKLIIYPKICRLHSSLKLDLRKLFTLDMDHCPSLFLVCPSRCMGVRHQGANE